MGSCISKCTRAKKKSKEEDLSHVHDKLVISQGPMIPRISPRKMMKVPSEKPLSPPPSSPSTSSNFSSFSCSTNSKSCTMASSTSSSSSSCSSSVLNAKDRSFSNEFLWSCVKDNPHIIGLNSPMLAKEKTILENQNSLFYPSPLVQKSKQSIQEKPAITVRTPKKRARTSSPTLVRQKSFRKDHNYSGPGPILNGPGLRSPSPSRRFNGPCLRSPSPSRRFNGPPENNRGVSKNGLYENSCGRSPIVSKGINNNAVNSATSSVRRESFRASNVSPARDSTIKGNISVREKDTFSQQVCAKNGGVAVGDIQGLEMDTIMEDINNPLIALDCFIFL